MIRRPPRSTPLYSSAASDVYKRQMRSRSTGCRPAGVSGRVLTPPLAVTAEGSSYGGPARVLMPPDASARRTTNWTLNRRRNATGPCRRADTPTAKPLTGSRVPAKSASWDVGLGRGLDVMLRLAIYIAHDYA